MYAYLKFHVCINTHHLKINWIFSFETGADREMKKKKFFNFFISGIQLSFVWLLCHSIKLSITHHKQERKEERERKREIHEWQSVIAHAKKKKNENIEQSKMKWSNLNSNKREANWKVKLRNGYTLAAISFSLNFHRKPTRERVRDWFDIFKLILCLSTL